MSSSGLTSANMFSIRPPTKINGALLRFGDPRVDEIHSHSESDSVRAASEVHNEAETLYKQERKMRASPASSRSFAAPMPEERYGRRYRTYRKLIYFSEDAGTQALS